MGRVERRSALPQPRASTIEYAVRGEWRQSVSDEGGEKGTWFIGVPELVATFGATLVKEKIEAYKAAMAAASDEAIEKAASAAAAPAAAAPAAAAPAAAEPAEE